MVEKFETGKLYQFISSVPLGSNIFIDNGTDEYNFEELSAGDVCPIPAKNEYVFLYIKTIIKYDNSEKSSFDRSCVFLYDNKLICFGHDEDTLKRMAVEVKT
jgi:hypothetical protein